MSNKFTAGASIGFPFRLFVCAYGVFYTLLLQLLKHHLWKVCGISLLFRESKRSLDVAYIDGDIIPGCTTMWNKTAKRRPDSSATCEWGRKKKRTLYMSQAICTLPCTTANNLSGFESKYFCHHIYKKLRVDKTVATQLATIHYTAQHHRQPQPANIPQRLINTSQTLAENQLHKGQLCYMPVSYVLLINWTVHKQAKLISFCLTHKAHVLSYRSWAAINVLVGSHQKYQETLRPLLPLNTESDTITVWREGHYIHGSEWQRDRGSIDEKDSIIEGDGI